MEVTSAFPWPRAGFSVSVCLSPSAASQSSLPWLHFQKVIECTKIGGKIIRYVDLRRGLEVSEDNTWQGNGLGSF